MTPWTQDEDNVLLQQIAVYGTKDQWRQIAEAIPGRTNKACRKRWLHSLSPDVKKSLWSASEDAALLALHAAHPGRWAAIARGIPGRTDDACSKRYREALDPQLRRDGWSAREDEELLALVARWEGRWTKVGQEMRRSSLGCRNRYRMLQRKMQMQNQMQSQTLNSNLTTAPAPSMSTSSPSPIEPEQIHDLQQRWPAPSDATTDAHPPELALGWGGFPYASQLMPPTAWQVTTQPHPHVHQHDTAVFAIDPSLQEPLQLDLELDAPGGSGSGTSALSSPQDEHGGAPFYQTSDAHYGQLDLHDGMEMDVDVGMQHVYTPADVDVNLQAQAFDDCQQQQHNPQVGQSSPTTSYGEDVPVPLPEVHAPPQPHRLDLDSPSNAPPLPSPTATAAQDGAQPSPTTARPAKRRRVEGPATSRLSSVRAVTSDAATLAYACGHPSCWPQVEREMLQDSNSTTTSSSISMVRFATSADLMAHKKAAHPDDGSGSGSGSGSGEEKIFRCALPGCGKAWKNINGIQYHLQVSRAHFRTAVNRVKCTTTPSGDADGHANPDPDQAHAARSGKAAEHGRPKKLYSCPRDGCPNRYKQLSGLKYHLSHGHPENPPLQLDELPHPLRRELGAVAPVA